MLFRSTQNSYLYAGTHRSHTPYRTFVLKLASITEQQPYCVINNKTSAGDIRSLVTENSLVLLTANHRFKKERRGHQNGPGQIRHVYYQRGRIRFEFKFDAWEVTSTSSYGNLSNNWICTSFLLIRNIVKSASGFTYKATCLGIGTNIFRHESNNVPFGHYYEFEEDDFPGGYEQFEE